MFRPLLQTFACIAFAAFAWQFRPGQAVPRPPGVLVPDAPAQTLHAPEPLPPVGDFQLTAVADYALAARVLRTKHYWADPGSDLVPVDVAVGWGPMSDTAVLDHLEITQSNRFYFYGWEDQPPLPRGVLSSHSANLHVIPATREVARTIRALRPGQLVTLSGQLVHVAGPNGFSWRTSLTRTDTGRGACELFRVEQARIEPR